MLVLTQSFTPEGAQVSRHGTGSFISYGRRKCRLKERSKQPHPTGEKPMAQVTYRGIKYDTNRNKTQQTNKVDLTYRGVSQKKELTSVK